MGHNRRDLFLVQFVMHFHVAWFALLRMLFSQLQTIQLPRPLNWQKDFNQSEGGFWSWSVTWSSMKSWARKWFFGYHFVEGHLDLLKDVAYLHTSIALMASALWSEDVRNVTLIRLTRNLFMVDGYRIDNIDLSCWRRSSVTTESFFSLTKEKEIYAFSTAASLP